MKQFISFVLILVSVIVGWIAYSIYNIPLVLVAALIFTIFYFFLVRPRQKKTKAYKQKLIKNSLIKTTEKVISTESAINQDQEPKGESTGIEVTTTPIIPEEISGYLTKDETIEKSFQSINYNNVNVRVYATNKRIYLVSANGMGSFSVEDIGYEHISKLQFVSRIYWELLLLGLFPLLLGFTFLASGLEVANIIFSIIMFGGVAVCVYFFLNYRPHHLSIYVSGLNNPMVLTGNKTELDALFKIVREKR